MTLTSILAVVFISTLALFIYYVAHWSVYIERLKTEIHMKTLFIKTIQDAIDKAEAENKTLKKQLSEVSQIALEARKSQVGEMVSDYTVRGLETASRALSGLESSDSEDIQKVIKLLDNLRDKIKAFLVSF